MRKRHQIRSRRTTGKLGHGELRHQDGSGVVQFGYACGVTIRQAILEDDGSPCRLDAFGVEQISPHVGLVLFGLLFAPASRLLGIAAAAWSRKHEFEADAFAAKATGKPESLVTALKKLSAKNLSNLTPHPFRVFLDYSHPPVLVRIHALREMADGRS